MTVSAAASVVDLAATRVLMESPEHLDQVGRVDVVSNLLSLVAVDRVLITRQRTLHEVRKKPVQSRSGMSGPRQAATSKARRLHAEVATVFLNKCVGSEFGNSEQRMSRMVDGHRFVDTLLRKRV